ncbi:hypothetical protein RB195_010121 [Necator americanus]|uniref:CCHC-type domain-containing protein n=1 Tax=Necator americanus TaxID=51031 RepID=A0ABR1CWI3_NECAM
MTFSLSARQGLLTRTGNRLSTILEEEANLLDMQFDPSMMDDSDIRTLRRRIRRANVVLETEANKLKIALENYGRAADNLDKETPSISEIISRVEANMDPAQGLLDQTQKAVTDLTRLQQDLEESRNYDTTTSLDVHEMKLTPIPTPKFNGRIWEWETFWRSFEHTVHSRNIDNLFKLNYLLDVLRGDARESALVDQLLHKLATTTARNERLEEQETLREQLHSIVSQLNLKGEHIDNTFLQKQLLAKFSVDIQRHILRQKAYHEKDNTWNTMALLSTAKEYVKSELKITRQVEQYQHNPTRKRQHVVPENRDTSNIPTKWRPTNCFYCNKCGHQPKNCTEVPTIEQRLHIMKTKKLCHNCGANDHIATKCPRGSCRVCGTTGHHTSICKKLFDSHSPPRLPPPVKLPKKQSQPTKPTTRASATPAKVNSVNFEPTLDVKPQPNTALHVNDNTEVMILAGQAQVLNPESAMLEPIYVILDTGADRSFISNEFAKRLQLKDVAYHQHLWIGRTTGEDVWNHGTANVGCQRSSAHFYDNQNR